MNSAAADGSRRWTLRLEIMMPGVAIAGVALASSYRRPTGLRHETRLRKQIKKHNNMVASGGTVCFS